MQDENNKIYYRVITIKPVYMHRVCTYNKKSIIPKGQKMKKKDEKTILG